MLLFHLSGENLNLSREEVLALAGDCKYTQINNILLVDTAYCNLFERLAYTHGIFDVLFISNKKDLMQDIMQTNFNKYYKRDFKVRILNFAHADVGFDEKKLGEIVYKKLEKPKVNLAKAKTQFFFIFAGSKIICCRLLKKIDKSHEKRKPHMKPELHPTSLSPKLAKALINLTGIRNGVLVDPFCGSGGILVEAGLIGLRPVGFDIDRIMIRRSKINIEHYNIKDYRLRLIDSTKLDKKIEYAVSELPFGKNSRLSDELETLYMDFLFNLKRLLIRRAVLVFPDFLNIKKLIKKSRLKVVHEFDYYVHKSMTKKIYILE